MHRAAARAKFCFEFWITMCSVNSPKPLREAHFSKNDLGRKRPEKKKCTAQEPERKGDLKRHHRMTTSDEARRRRAALDAGGAPPPTHIKQHIRNDLNFAKDGTAQQRERNLT